MKRSLVEGIESRTQYSTLFSYISYTCYTTLYSVHFGNQILSWRIQWYFNHVSPRDGEFIETCVHLFPRFIFLMEPLIGFIPGCPPPPFFQWWWKTSNKLLAISCILLLRLLPTIETIHLNLLNFNSFFLTGNAKGGWQKVNTTNLKLYSVL